MPYYIDSQGVPRCYNDKPQGTPCTQMEAKKALELWKEARAKEAAKCMTIS